MKASVIQAALADTTNIPFSIQTTAGYKFILSNYTDIVLNEANETLTLTEIMGGYSYIVDIIDIDLIVRFKDKVGANNQFVNPSNKFIPNEQ